MIGEFEEAGYQAADDPEAGEGEAKDGPEPDAVVVAFDPSLTYAKLCRAAWWISRGKPYLATNPDQVCPTDLPTILPDCGALCAALKEATGRSPDAVLGKPNPLMLAGLLEKRGLEPAQLAIVGDRLHTDMAMAHQAGAVGVLTLTGEAQAGDAAASPEPPHLVVANLAEFGRLLAESRADVAFSPSAT